LQLVSRKSFAAQPRSWSPIPKSAGGSTKRPSSTSRRVPLIIVPGNTLVAIRKAYDRAEKEKVCVMVKDQLTDAVDGRGEAFSYENGNLPFERRQQLMNQWDPVVHNFRYSPFHVIACGRLGFHWTNVEDEETGQTKLLQGDSKFNAGGGQNFGYEADLELEMRRRKRMLKALFRSEDGGRAHLRRREGRGRRHPQRQAVRFPDEPKVSTKPAITSRCSKASVRTSSS
jgi:hypothetical protein